jgi:hypothetical protein
MDVFNDIYNIRPLALLFLTAETLIEHFQVLSFLSKAANPDEEEWTVKTAEFLKWFNDHFLFDTEGHYKTYFTICSMITVSICSLYALFMKKIHKINSKSFSYFLSLILIVDHVILGPGALMMIDVLLSNSHCDQYEHLLSDPEVDCWTSSHLFLLWLGKLFIALILAFIMGICPILRAERAGAEKQFGNDGFCPAVYKGYLYLSVAIFAPLQEPVWGVVIGLAAVFYFVVFEGYEETHVVKIKIASIFGIVWAFFCCNHLNHDKHAASDMLLVGWGFSMAFGYSLLAIKLSFFERKQVELTIDNTKNIN